MEIDENNKKEMGTKGAIRVGNASSRFPLRAEFAILIGMVLVVASLFMTWAQEKPDLSGYQALAVHVEGAMVQQRGFGTPVWIPLTVCAIVCGSTLLWNITAQNRLALSAIAGAGGLACLVIALSRFALLPGLLLGLTGSAFLLFGAIDRYTRGSKTQE